MSEIKKKKTKISPEEVLALTSEMIGGLKKNVEKQDEKIDLLVKTFQKNNEVQNNIKPIKINQVGTKEQDYVFFVNVIGNLEHWKLTLNSEVKVREKIEEFKSKLEVLMLEYKIQEVDGKFLKKL